jgi:PAS domain S-box-containing protein
MENINDNLHHGFILTGITFLAMVITGLVAAAWIVKLIRRLQKYTQALIAGNWQPPLDEAVPIQEISELNQSFNATAAQLGSSLERIHRAWQESEAKFTKIFRSSPDPVLITDQEGVILEVNDRMVEFYGYGVEELVGRRVLDLGFWVEEEERQRFRDLLFSEGTVSNLEVEQLVRGGVIKTVLVSAELQFLEGQLCVIGIVKDITERKELELKLKHSQAQLQDVLDNTIASIVSFRVFADLDWEYEYQSIGSLSLFGYTSEEITTNKYLWLSRVLPEDREAFLMPLLENILAEDTQSVEFRFLHKDGSIRWISAIYNSHKAVDEDYWVVTGFSIDITTRKQAEVALRESERKFSTIFHASPKPAWIATLADGRFLGINENLQEFLRCSESEVLGKTYRELQIWQDTDKYEAYFQQLHQAGKIRDFEMNLCLDKNNIRTVLISANVTKIEGKDCVIGVLKDITERKLIEEKIQEQETFLRSIYEGTEQAIFVVDVDLEENFRFISFNPAHQRLVGLSLEQLYGKTPEEAQIPEWEAVTQYCRECLQAQRSLTSEIWVDLNGRNTCCYTTLTPVFNHQGRIYRLIGTTLEITKLKQLEARLQKALEEINSHFDSSPLGIILWDKEMRIMRWSKQVEQIFGWSFAEVEGFAWRELSWVYAEDTERVFRAVEDLCQQKIPNVTLQNRNYTKDGRLITCQWYSSIIFDEQGQTISILSFVEDITEQKAAKIKLEKSEERFRMALGVSKAIAWERNLATDEIFFVTKGNVFPPERMSYEDAMNLVHPEDRECVRKANSEVIRTGGSFEIEHRTLATPKSSGCWFQVSAKVVQDQQQQPVSIIGMSVDITDLKKAEAALRQSEERFRSAFEDAGVGMALVDLEGNFFKVNRALSELLGYPEAELLGMGFQDITHPEDLAGNLQGLGFLLAGRLKTYQSEKRYRHASGSLVWGIVSVSLVRGEEEKLLYFVAQVQDISERHELERLKGEFIGIVSHELRTPLTSIRGSLGLLESGILAEEPVTSQRMLEIALRNCDRLIRLVNDILDLERLSSGQTELPKQVCSVQDLLEEALESVQAIATQAAITIQLEVAEAQVYVNRDAIIQTLINLLSNAIKFSPLGSNIWVRTEIEEPYLVWAVQDQGRGIPADKLKTIFGRFQQVDVSDAREKGGKGLGLAICQSSIEQHRGRIWVESVLGEGSTFYFTLPLGQ